jgi:hypothetical protein
VSAWRGRDGRYLREVVTVALVLTFSLFLRLANLDALIVSDEMRWACRSLGFRRALLEQDWAKTFRVGHPGVITTWLGSAFIPKSSSVPGGEHRAEEVCRVTDDAKRLYLAGETSQEVSRRLAEVGEDVFAGRVGVAVFTWLSLGALYLLVRSRWRVEIAVAALTLVALSPFHLAHSRFLHLDAVLSSLMSLSVVSLVVATGERSGRRLGYVALSGVTGGLAALQKSPAMFLAPFAGLILVVDVVRRARWPNRDEERPGQPGEADWRRALRDLVVWGAAAGIVYVLLWPSMWVDPIGTLGKVFGKALGYAEEGHTLGNYFMGRPVLDPGWAFYPTAVLFRLSPLSFVGLLASVGWLIKGRGRGAERFGLLVLLLYGVLFGAFMTWGAKKFDRYILPVFPTLEIAAGCGLVWLISAVRKGLRRVPPGFDVLNNARWASLLGIGTAAMAVILQVGVALPHRPHYLTYYNPLLGGVGRAKDVLLLGWGEGYGEAIAYLNEKPNAQELQVAVGRFSGFAPLFPGEPRSMETYSVWETDYVVNYISQVQRRRNEDILREYFYNPEAEPEHVVTLHGVDYVWIYPNRHYVEPAKYVIEHAHDGRGDGATALTTDCLLVNGDSLFAKHYPRLGGADVDEESSRGQNVLIYEFRGKWNPAEEAYTYSTTEQVARLLKQMRTVCRRVWYVRYPEYEPDGYVKLLEKQGLLLKRKTYPHVEVLLYQLATLQVERSLGLQYGNVRLLGYGPTDPLPAWGRDGGLSMAWEVAQPVVEDYSTFLHLYDAHGHRIAQGDARLVDEALRPTSEWEPGVPKTVLYHLSIPPGTPPGKYELAVGVYDVDTGHRLPLLGDGEESEGKSARLQVQVGAPRIADSSGAGNTVLAIAHDLEREVVPGLKVLGYDLEHEAILSGDALPIRLAWETTDEMEQDYRLQLGLRDNEGVVHTVHTFELVATDYPTSRWRAGELLQAWYYVPVAEDLPTGEMTLMVNLLSEHGQPARAQPVAVTTVWLQSRQPGFQAPEHIGERRGIELGDKIVLLGHDAEPTVRAGDDLQVTVYWQATQEGQRMPIKESYKTFVHLYDGQGAIVAQQDRVPGLGARPTTTWERGEVVGDRLLVPIDSHTPVGRYQLAIGLYDQETGKRLPPHGPDGQRLAGDRIPLGEVAIEP